MSKARIAAVAVAIAMIGMPVAFSASAASAATSGSGTPSVSGTQEFTAADRGEDDGDHHTKTRDNEDDHGYIPPVVIRPHEDGDENDDDNGGPIGGGVIPGPIPTGAPTPNAVSYTHLTLPTTSRV